MKYSRELTLYIQYFWLQITTTLAKQNYFESTAVNYLTKMLHNRNIGDNEQLKAGTNVRNILMGSDVMNLYLREATVFYRTTYMCIKTRHVK